MFSYYKNCLYKNLNILNQYLFPKCVYMLQTTPVDLLENTDKIMHQGVRKICGLPSDTPIIPVYYSGCKLRGLGNFWVTREA